MMDQVKCIEKIRDKNNHIIEYKVIDKSSNVTSVKPDALKRFIRSGQIEVTNLTLTSDNRLIAKKTDTSSSKSNINVETIFNKAKILGYIIKTFDTKCGHKCHIASSPDNTKHIFIIPDDVKYIYNVLNHRRAICSTEIHRYMSDIEGTLKVVGGKNLVTTNYMFYGCEVQSLDLTLFNTSNVKNMSGMFMACEAHSIDLRSFNTSKVTDMDSMFRECKAKSIDLSSFDTSNVKNMSSMFCDCKAQSIDLSSFNTSNVEDMSYMFSYCKAHSIDLRSFNTSKVTDMNNMFSYCKAHSIDLASFNMSNVVYMHIMFYKCKAQIKTTDPKLKDQLQSNMR